MQNSSKLYVGLDMHKESIAVAYAPEEQGAEVVFLGTIGPRQGDIDTLVHMAQGKHANQVVVAIAREVPSAR
jgi:transposase